MNQLEDMSVAAATDLVALLDAWDAADDAQSTQDLADVEGKVLVKADVLEWEVVNGGVSGPAKEKAKIEDDVRQIMSFCSCLGGYLGSSYLRSYSFDPFMIYMVLLVTGIPCRSRRRGHPRMQTAAYRGHRKRCF